MGPVTGTYVNDSARRSVEYDFGSNSKQIMFLSDSHNAIIAMAAAAPVSEVPSHASVFPERTAEHDEKVDVRVRANENQGGITAIQGCMNAVILGVRDDFVSQTPIG